jgi:hypothetical protein
MFSLSVYIIKWGQVFEVDRKNGREQAFKSNKQTKQEKKVSWFLSIQNRKRKHISVS